jgi:hypothetical protein
MVDSGLPLSGPWPRRPATPAQAAGVAAASRYGTHTERSSAFAQPTTGDAMTQAASHRYLDHPHRTRESAKPIAFAR